MTIILVSLIFRLTYPNATSSATSASSRSGRSDGNLGGRPAGFGSQGQAQELLLLIRQRPGLAEYTISYQTDIDRVDISCDFLYDVLTRTYTRPDNHGTTERWYGSLESRLQSAAGGESLNDTPSGKSFATSSNF